MAKTLQLVPKDIIFPVATVLDKEHQELYKEAFAKTAEQFGKDSPAYKTITNGINKENVTGSQFFWNTNLNQYLPSNQRVMNLKDLESINDLDESFFNGIYSDTPQLTLRTAEASQNQNKYLLENLVEQVKQTDKTFSSENPLIISNLELVQDNNSKNKYGLLLKITDNTTLQNDIRFAYSNNNKSVKFGERKKTFYTKKQGLSRVYAIDCGLNSRNDDLANSDNNGRVVVVDAEGVGIEKMQKYIEDIKQVAEKQILEIQTRTKIAEKYIRTGKFD